MSNTFSSWGSFNPSTFTANAGIAPDGSNTAWNGNNTYTNSGGRSQTITLTNPSVGDVYIFSIWAKKTTSNSSTCAYLAINISGGSNSSSLSSNCPTITDQWQRIYLTKTIDFIDRTSLLVTMGNNPTVANTNILYWGAQLEKASSSSRYIATTALSSTQYLQGYLGEGTSTNLTSQSSTLSNFSYTNLASVATTAPDGSAYANQFTFDQAAGNRIFLDSCSSNGTYSGSVYAKGVASSTISQIKVQIKDCVTDTIRGASVWMTLSSSSWIRIHATGTTAGGNPGYRFEITTNAVGSTAKAWLWGAQIESSKAATSLIVTNGSTRSRGTDTLTYPSANFVSSTRTISANYTQLSKEASSRNYLLNITDVGFNRFAIRTSEVADTVPQLVVGNGTINTTITFSAGTQTYGSQNSLYARYSSSTSSLTINGSTLNGSNGYVDLGSTTMNIGSSSSSTAQNILIKNIKSSSRYYDWSELYDFGF